MSNNKKRDTLQNYLIVNANEEWKLLNKASKINNKKNINKDKQILNSLTLCSLELIKNIELSEKTNKHIVN